VQTNWRARKKSPRRFVSIDVVPPDQDITQLTLIAPRMIWVTNESSIPTDWKMVAP
jgi:hypothetical protein